MGYEAARGNRSSRFHSSGSERGHAAHAAPAVDYALYEDDDDVSFKASASVSGKAGVGG